MSVTPITYEASLHSTRHTRQEAPFAIFELNHPRKSQCPQASHHTGNLPVTRTAGIHSMVPEATGRQEIVWWPTASLKPQPWTMWRLQHVSHRPSLTFPPLSHMRGALLVFSYKTFKDFVDRVGKHHAADQYCMSSCTASFHGCSPWHLAAPTTVGPCQATSLASTLAGHKGC